MRISRISFIKTYHLMLHQVKLKSYGLPVNRKKDIKSILAKKEDFCHKYYSTFYDSYDITIDNNILRKIA